MICYLTYFIIHGIENHDKKQGMSATLWCAQNGVRYLPALFGLDLPLYQYSILYYRQTPAAMYVKLLIYFQHCLFFHVENLVFPPKDKDYAYTFFLYLPNFHIVLFLQKSSTSIAYSVPKIKL